MIKNDKQLKYSKEWAEKFEKTNRKLFLNEEKRLKEGMLILIVQDVAKNNRFNYHK